MQYCFHLIKSSKYKKEKTKNFFLWGHLRNKVYKTPPNDLKDLRDCIIHNVTKLKNHPKIIKNQCKL